MAVLFLLMMLYTVFPVFIAQYKLWITFKGHWLIEDEFLGLKFSPNLGQRLKDIDKFLCLKFNTNLGHRLKDIDKFLCLKFSTNLGQR